MICITQINLILASASGSLKVPSGLVPPPPPLVSLFQSDHRKDDVSIILKPSNHQIDTVYRQKHENMMGALISSAVSPHCINVSPMIHQSKTFQHLYPLLHLHFMFQNKKLKGWKQIHYRIPNHLHLLHRPHFLNYAKKQVI